MSITDEKNGQIFTFYSFKGGVGRTMALANVAFLAAQNNLRVLVMDWDLEAPGLAYYFRALLEIPDVKSLKDAPGILDILWQWRIGIKNAKTETEVSSLLKTFQGGNPFEDCVRQLLDPQYAVLDFIGAGSRQIKTPKLRTYEEALAHFSWSAFFDKEAGGHVIENLRKWAKNNYDIILVDSRTGLADAAGICTMQIPDAVALCFILNRQNIDGIAKIGAAIRMQRGDAIALRLLPMRVARQNTSEESDARARAHWELKRVGGFPAEAIIKDFRNLAVLAADNVPFYETLAPFTVANYHLDPLTLNYLGITTELMGKELSMPSLDLEWIESVRRRLQPRHATVEYIANLKTVDPNRMVSELQQLIDSAFDAEIDGGEIEDNYIVALVNAVQELSQGNYDVNLEDLEQLQNRTLNLLRVLVNENPSQWLELTISTIEHSLTMFFLGTEEELPLYEELDGLLAQSDTIENWIKRLANLRRMAKLYISYRDKEATMEKIDEIRALIQQQKSNSVLSDYFVAITATTADISLMTGDIFYLMQNDSESAIKEYKQGLCQLEKVELENVRFDLSNLYFELHSRIALLPSGIVGLSDAAYHAIQAAKWGTSYHFTQKFVSLAQVVLKLKEHPELAVEFCDAALDNVDLSAFTFNFGRQSKSSLDFLTVIDELCSSIIKEDNVRSESTLIHIADTVILFIRYLSRRRLSTHSNDLNLIIFDKLHNLIGLLKQAGVQLDKISLLEEYSILLVKNQRSSDSRKL